MYEISPLEVLCCCVPRDLSESSVVELDVCLSVGLPIISVLYFICGDPTFCRALLQSLNVCRSFLPLPIEDVTLVLQQFVFFAAVIIVSSMMVAISVYAFSMAITGS